jgi:hypothetical protein
MDIILYVSNSAQIGSQTASEAISAGPPLGRGDLFYGSLANRRAMHLHGHLTAIGLACLYKIDHSSIFSARPTAEN